MGWCCGLHLLLSIRSWDSQCTTESITLIWPPCLDLTVVKGSDVESFSFDNVEIRSQHRSHAGFLPILQGEGSHSANAASSHDKETRVLGLPSDAIGQFRLHIKLEGITGRRERYHDPANTTAIEVSTQPHVLQDKDLQRNVRVWERSEGHREESCKLEHGSALESNAAQILDPTLPNALRTIVSLRLYMYAPLEAKETYVDAFFPCQSPVTAI